MNDNTSDDKFDKADTADKAEFDKNEFTREFLAATEGMDPASVIRSHSDFAAQRAEPVKRQLELPPPPATPSRFVVRVDLVAAKPFIWRRLAIPGDLTLDRVHDALQLAFGWTDSHLHRFTPTDDRYGSEAPAIVTQYDIDEGEDGVLETEIRLDQLVEAAGDSFYYTYDFGDDWEHKVVVESVGVLDAGDRGIRCTDGRRQAPPEDSGGVHWYEHLIEVARDPQHPESADLAEAIDYSGVRALDDTLDLEQINLALARLEGAPETLAWLAERDSALSRLFGRANGEAQRFLAGYVTDARLAGPESGSVSEAQAAKSTAVIRTFLGDVPADGIPLTSAGYLPPTSVAAMMADLDPDKRWIGETNRELQTQPLLELRETVTALGLTRKYRGRLQLTTRGTALRDSPVKLWEYLATKLPVERSAYGQDIGILLLMLVGAGETDLGSSLDMMTLMVGWQLEEPDRFAGATALRTVGATRDVLAWAGSGVLITRGRRATALAALAAPAARQLARAAIVAASA